MITMFLVASLTSNMRHLKKTSSMRRSVKYLGWSPSASDIGKENMSTNVEEASSPQCMFSQLHIASMIWKVLKSQKSKNINEAKNEQLQF